MVFCDLIAAGPGRCPGCGATGVYRDSVQRRVTDVPVVGHPLQLRVKVPRYRCRRDDCAREVFVHDTSRLARPGASTTRRCASYVLRRLIVDKATVSAVARELGVFRPGRAVTGAELAAMDDIELAHVLDTTDVFARVAPSHKLRIVEILQRKGNVVAMTGMGSMTRRLCARPISVWPWVSRVRMSRNKPVL